jgi:hypothetical protein
MTRDEALRYEICAAWWVNHLPARFTRLAGRYFSWLVDRKLRRYKAPTPAPAAAAPAPEPAPEPTAASAPGGRQWFTLNDGHWLELADTGFAIELTDRPLPGYRLHHPGGHVIAFVPPGSLDNLKTLTQQLAAERDQFVPVAGDAGWRPRER